MEETVATFEPAGDAVDTSHLAKQDLENLDIDNLNPLTPEVISRQATINIGTIGHVAHGKSTVVRAISGVQTVRFKNELERNITIKLGYANAKIYKCRNEDCPRPGCYAAYGSIKEDQPKCLVEGCEGTMKLLRHVSFVDCFDPKTEVILNNGDIVTVAQLSNGDVLKGPDGLKRTVKKVWTGEKEMFELRYKSESPCDMLLESDKVRCTGGHLLVLRIDHPVVSPFRLGGHFFVREYRKSGSRVYFQDSCFETEEEAFHYYDHCDKTPIVYENTVEGYIHSPPQLQSLSKLFYSGFVEFEDSVDLEEGEVSSEEMAWLLGLWLSIGNPDSTCFDIGVHQTQVFDKIKSIANRLGLIIKSQKMNSNNKVRVSVTTKESSSKNMLLEVLYRFNMISNKHIPNAIAFGHSKIRMGIVAGFVDAMACFDEEGYHILRNTDNEELIHKLSCILKSLGFSSILEKLDSSDKEEIRLTFNGECSKLPICSFEKKGRDVKANTSQSFEVIPVGNGEYVGFEVDGDGRILFGDLLVGHNCPGHDILMATMLNGAAVMDAALLLIAGNESCPQPQTSEHLAAIDIMRLKNIVILQNKIDLVKEQDACEKYKQIVRFIKGTIADGSPIIPISAQLKYNIDVILEYLVKRIPVPVRDFKSSPKLIVIRSFDVNKPGAEVDELKGGVAGGSLMCGVLKIGDEIEVRPGIVSKDDEGNVKCMPIFSRIISLFAERNDLKYAIPGGLIGVGTKIDPTLCRADRLVGQVLGAVGNLPHIFIEIEINFFLLRRLLGVKSTGDKQHRVRKMAKGEILMVNIGSTSTGGRIQAVKADLAKISLLQPVCTQEGEKIALSRRVDKHWRLIGWGKILKGKTIEVQKQ